MQDSSFRVQSSDHSARPRMHETARYGIVLSSAVSEIPLGLMRPDMVRHWVADVLEQVAWKEVVGATANGASEDRGI